MHIAWNHLPKSQTSPAWPSGREERPVGCSFKTDLGDLRGTHTGLYEGLGAVRRDLLPVHQAGLRLRRVAPLNDVVASHVGVVVPREEDPISHPDRLLDFQIIFNEKEGHLLAGVKYNTVR